MIKIKQPTLLISKQKAIANIKRMLDKTEDISILRPHFKTHQSKLVGELFRDNGITKITVSSVSMAKYFADDGWNDITIAFPFNIHEINDVADLAENNNINLLVESVDTTEFLINNLNISIGIFIKIDTGYHRTGLAANDSSIEKIIQAIKGSKLRFMGFLTHAGHTYTAKGKNEILEIMNESKFILNQLKSSYVKEFPEIIISYGDTPSCSMAESFEGIDEIRPGNFIYYDVMQFHIGSCSFVDIAVAVACPIVALHPERDEIVIYGGGIHLSKEFIVADNDFRLFGYVVEIGDDGWSNPVPGAYVSSLSQEHGIIKVLPGTIGNYKIGEIIGILPIHSCMSANLLKNSTQLLTNS